MSKPDLRVVGPGSTRDYPRERVLEMLRRGEIEPTRKALEASGRTEQKAKTDLEHFKKSGGANYDGNPRINGRGSSRSDRESHISEVESHIGGSEGVVPSRRQESASSRTHRNTASVEPTQPQRVTNDALPPIQAVKKPHLSHRDILNVLSVVLALAIQVLNWNYSSSLGLDPISSKILGAIGLIAGVCAALLPAYVYDLAKQKAVITAIIAGCFYLLCLWMEFMATSGFFGRQIGNSLKEYGVSIEERQRAELKLATAQNELWKLPSIIDPRVREQQIQEARRRVPRDYLSWSNDCTKVKNKIWDECSELKGLHDAVSADEKAAQDRQKAKDEVAAAEAALHKLPVIASQDASGDFVNQISQGKISQNQFDLSRMSGWTAFACFGPGILRLLARVVGR